jgi:hypothetical protein
VERKLRILEKRHESTTPSRLQKLRTGFKDWKSNWKSRRATRKAEKARLKEEARATREAKWKTVAQRLSTTKNYAVYAKNNISNFIRSRFPKGKGATEVSKDFNELENNLNGVSTRPESLTRRLWNRMKARYNNADASLRNSKTEIPTAEKTRWTRLGEFVSKLKVKFNATKNAETTKATDKEGVSTSTKEHSTFKANDRLRIDGKKAIVSKNQEGVAKGYTKVIVKKGPRYFSEIIVKNESITLVKKSSPSKAKKVEKRSQATNSETTILKPTKKPIQFEAGVRVKTKYDKGTVSADQSKTSPGYTKVLFDSGKFAGKEIYVRNSLLKTAEGRLKHLTKQKAKPAAKSDKQVPVKTSKTAAEIAPKPSTNETTSTPAQTPTSPITKKKVKAKTAPKNIK